MVYCMSDIHGEIDKFHAILDLIEFSEADILYVLGDVIDRYPGGVEWREAAVAQQWWWQHKEGASVSQEQRRTQKNPAIRRQPSRVSGN